MVAEYSEQQAQITEGALQFQRTIDLASRIAQRAD